MDMGQESETVNNETNFDEIIPQNESETFVELESNTNLAHPIVPEWVSKLPFPQRFAMVFRYAAKKKKLDRPFRIGIYVPLTFYLILLLQNPHKIFVNIIFFILFSTIASEMFFFQKRKWVEDNIQMLLGHSLKKEDVPDIIDMLLNPRIRNSKLLQTLLGFGLDLLTTDDAHLLKEQHIKHLDSMLKKWHKRPIENYKFNACLSIIFAANRLRFVSLRPVIEEIAKDNGYRYPIEIVNGARSCIQTFDNIPKEEGKKPDLAVSSGSVNPKSDTDIALLQPQVTEVPTHLDPLITQLRSMLKQAKYIVAVADGILITLFSIGMIFNIATSNPTILIVFILLAITVYPILRKWVYSKATRRAAADIAKSSDIKVIPLLIELLDSLWIEHFDTNEPDLLTIICETLEKLLPRLRSSDASLLSRKHLDTLARLLQSNTRLFSNSKLELNIIKAFEQIGDSSVLPIISKIANGEGIGIAYNIQKAAMECLPYLQQRKAHEEEAKTLLRASSLTATSPDELLRAVSYSEPTTSDELLRHHLSSEQVGKETQTLQAKQ